MLPELPRLLEFAVVFGRGLAGAYGLGKTVVTLRRWKDERAAERRALLAKVNELERNNRALCGDLEFMRGAYRELEARHAKAVLDRKRVLATRRAEKAEDADPDLRALDYQRNVTYLDGRSERLDQSA